MTFGQIYGQKKQCYCDKDTLMNNATVSSCKTRILKNKAKLYWQYNCDKIWLTLETINGKKVTLDEVPVELYGYTYRLGFHFVKEFDKIILFRSGCPANGPCIYTLIDKNTGKKIKELEQLICINTDVTEDKEYQFDFVIYYSENYEKLIIYYVNTKKTLTIPFNAKRNNLTGIIPEQQFNKMNLVGNILTIYYTTTDNKELNLKINLTNKKYSN
ncbi:MAG: hypothetical protein RLZZ323_1402 [Bacteroidota bacterium]